MLKCVSHVNIYETYTIKASFQICIFNPALSLKYYLSAGCEIPGGLYFLLCLSGSCLCLKCVCVSKIPLKIFCWNMDWCSCLIQTDLSPSVCLQIPLPLAVPFCLISFCFPCLIGWADFSREVGTPEQLTENKHLETVAFSQHFWWFCGSDNDFFLSSQQMWLGLNRNKY